jgi:uncharacterized membrane protein YgcG
MPSHDTQKVCEIGATVAVTALANSPSWLYTTVGASTGVPVLVKVGLGFDVAAKWLSASPEAAGLATIALTKVCELSADMVDAASEQPALFLAPMAPLAPSPGTIAPLGGDLLDASAVPDTGSMCAVDHSASGSLEAWDSAAAEGRCDIPADSATSQDGSTSATPSPGEWSGHGGGFSGGGAAGEWSQQGPRDRSDVE